MPREGSVGKKEAEQKLGEMLVHVLNYWLITNK